MFLFILHQLITYSLLCFQQMNGSSCNAVYKNYANQRCTLWKKKKKTSIVVVVYRNLWLENLIYMLSNYFSVEDYTIENNEITFALFVLLRWHCMEKNNNTQSLHILTGVEWCCSRGESVSKSKKKKIWKIYDIHKKNAFRKSNINGNYWTSKETDKICDSLSETETFDMFPKVKL